MNNKRIISFLLMIIVMCFGFSACRHADTSNNREATQENIPDNDIPGNAPIDTEPTDAETSVTDLPSIDIETNGGCVIVGKINVDDRGWYIEPEQPLNITYQYFLDDPSVFPNQTRIAMFDPQMDGVEKAVYIGQTVTVAGTLRFFRDDFETLYFAPYTITIGKNAESSYSAPDLKQEEPASLYDPSEPLPKYMDVMVVDGEYFYNAFMLSQETIELMGNDFAIFFVGFVDAFLNYQTEYHCTNKNYAEMLSTILFYEFPLYNACAEPFEYFKHYDSEKGMITIPYKYDEAECDRITEQFIDIANTLLADAKPGQTEEEMARNIYHALCTRMTYDYSALEDFERKESYYAYLNNSGVCITFANVYNQLLTQVGIETTLAYCDNIDTISHIWSIITLDGKQYFCDPTYELSYDKGNGYRYFGMNYADRTANGFGELGIRYGRYNVRLLDSESIAEESLK